MKRTILAAMLAAGVGRAEPYIDAPEANPNSAMLVTFNEGAGGKNWGWFAAGAVTIDAQFTYSATLPRYYSRGNEYADYKYIRWANSGCYQDFGSRDYSTILVHKRTGTYNLTAAGVSGISGSAVAADWIVYKNVPSTGAYGMASYKPCGNTAVSACSLNTWFLWCATRVDSTRATELWRNESSVYSGTRVDWADSANRPNAMGYPSGGYPGQNSQVSYSAIMPIAITLADVKVLYQKFVLNEL